MTENLPSHEGTDAPSRNVSRRRFLQAGSASVAAAAGGNAVAGLAEAAHGRESKHVIVVGRGEYHHEYEIKMENGGTIQKATHAGGNDSVHSQPTPRVEGELMNWNVDSYEYTGEIDRVVADGSVSFQFVDGAFGDDDRIVAGGVDSRNGTANYVIGTNSGDVSPVSETTNHADSDQGGSRTEQGYSNDHVTGQVDGDGVDTHDIGGSQPVQYVHVKNGHVAVSGYKTEAATTTTSGNKEASIVYHYMGDGPFTTFFQNFNDLRTPQKGYDKSVLLKHKNTSVAAQALADRIEKPTRENFEDVVHSLVEQGYTIDLYIMSHGLRGKFKMSTGQFGSKDWYDTADVERLRSEFDGQIPLRMVYQCHCWGKDMNAAWRKLGAKAVLGSRYVNFFPNQWSDFVKQWKRGYSFEESYKRANTASSRTAARMALAADVGMTRQDSWATEKTAPNTCTDWVVFHTSGGCAEDYFKNRWLHNDQEWHSIIGNDGDPLAGPTGWDFILKSSEKFIAGDGSITKNFSY